MCVCLNKKHKNYNNNNQTNGFISNMDCSSYGFSNYYGDHPSYQCHSINDHEDLNTKDDEMSFVSDNYAKELLKMMFMMRSHNMLTDVVLEVNQELFPAHKVVLSAASPYFKAMFTGGLKETEMSRVQLQGVCPTAMGRIIYFMYTGQIRVTEVTVCQLLPAATMFQVPNVIAACCDFLEGQLDPSNAIGIGSFAEQHGCIELQRKANQFIERHFTQVCQEEEFLQLTAYQLISLIRRDELNVQEEREVYQAVLKWVKYDEENRYPKMGSILGAVRCQLLTPKFLKEQMNNCNLLRKVPACREYLAKVFRDLTLHKRVSVKERKPNTKRMIFVAGGFYRQSLDILEAFNVDEKTWIKLPGLRIPRSGLGAAFLKGRFFAVGGRNNCIDASYDSDWVDRYQLLTEIWRPCAPMSVPRHRLGVAVMDELMYAVGGSAGSEYHNSAEYYDPSRDSWHAIKPMHQKRLGVGVVVVNRLLYAIGGFDGVNRLDSVECYHPENNEWNYVPSMSCGRSGAGVAAINQFIYVVGGFDGTRQVNTVERFDTENQVWELMTPVEIARSALSLTALDGKLYAIGGFDGTNFLTIVEVYDPKTNVWETTTPLSSGRSGHASAVIYQPTVDNELMECLKSSDISAPKDPPDDDDGNSHHSKYSGNCTDNSTGTRMLSQYNFRGGHDFGSKHANLRELQNLDKNKIRSEKTLVCTYKKDLPMKNCRTARRLMKKSHNEECTRSIKEVDTKQSETKKTELKSEFNIQPKDEICIKSYDRKECEKEDDEVLIKINEEEEEELPHNSGSLIVANSEDSCTPCKQLRRLKNLFLKTSTSLNNYKNSKPS